MTNGRPPVLEVENLSVIYDDSPALEDVSFALQSGDSLAIIGPNGAGKSTLMKAVMGLLQPRPGSKIRVDGGFERLGYVPQHSEVDLSFPVTVYDVVMMGLTRRIGWFRWPNREHRQLVEAALDRVGLAHVARRPIGDLSGGQQRRTFIARALAQQADILLLDEPFAGVDVAAESELMATIKKLNEAGITIVLSTHDIQQAFTQFKLVMALNRRMIAFGPARELEAPEVLSALYGGISLWRNGERVTVFVDEHGCC